MKLNDYANMFKIDKEVLTLNDFKTSELFILLKKLRIDKDIVEKIKPYKDKVQNAFIAYGAEYFNSIHKREYEDNQVSEGFNEQKWLDTFKQEFQAILWLDEQEQVEYGEDYGISLYYDLYNQMINTNSLDEVDYSDVKKFRRMIIKKKLRSKPVEKPIERLDIKQMLSERGIERSSGKGVKNNGNTDEVDIEKEIEKEIQTEIHKEIQKEMQKEITNEFKQGTKQFNGIKKLDTPKHWEIENKCPIEELKAEFLLSYASLFPNETLFRLALDAYTSKLVLKLKQ